MAELLTTQKLKVGLHRIAQKMEVCKDELNALDGQLGDGDIGITVASGFKNILEQLDTLPEDVSMALIKCGQIFTQSRASSFGTLLATGIMTAGKTVQGQAEVEWSNISTMIKEAIEKMSLRGKSHLGDKTVLDALEAIRIAVEGKIDPDKMLEAADRSVNDALEVFRSKPCKQGRARMFAARSTNLYDPGMVVIKRILEGLAGN